MESLACSALRKNELAAWLKDHCGFKHFQLQALVADASARRYHRVLYNDTSYVVMDADPIQDKCLTFIQVAKDLRSAGIAAPDVHFYDLKLGLMLLTDFGDNTLLKVLSTSTADVCYQQALTTLLRIQTVQPTGYTLPQFDQSFLHQEWQWIKEWVFDKWLNLSKDAHVMEQSYAMMSEVISEQPMVFMHRDFHARNLMWRPSQPLAVLDFQDAFIGPVTYDCVSLLRDCYIDWPMEHVNTWLQVYWSQLPRNQFNTIPFERFKYWFDWMGLQRHLKALLTFVRKSLRDGNDNYLPYIPRTLNYLISVSELYPELRSCYSFMRNTLKPCIEEKLQLCEA